MAPPTPESSADTRTETPASDGRGDGRGDPDSGVRELGIDALLALQLAAHGYSPVRIAQLRHRGTAGATGVARDLQKALAVLGVGTVREAVAEARRRGLIV